MIYHYFGGKEKLYLEVLEHVLARLREAELPHARCRASILPHGILQLYDFTEGHFSKHPECCVCCRAKTSTAARYLKLSPVIPAMSSPVLDKCAR